MYIEVHYAVSRFRMWRLSKHAAVDTEGGEPVKGYSEMETECKRPDIIRSPNIRTSVCLPVCLPPPPLPSLIRSVIVPWLYI